MTLQSLKPRVSLTKQVLDIVIDAIMSGEVARVTSSTNPIQPVVSASAAARCAKPSASSKGASC